MDAGEFAELGDEVGIITQSKGGCEVEDQDEAGTTVTSSHVCGLSLKDKSDRIIAVWVPAPDGWCIILA